MAAVGLHSQILQGFVPVLMRCSVEDWVGRMHRSSSSMILPIEVRLIQELILRV